VIPMGRQSKLKNEGSDIPRVLETLHHEKVSEVIPVKVQLSLKNCLVRIAAGQGVSTWIRQVIIEKLERLARERGGS